MNTPVYDFISEYIASDFSRLHMPGHKGSGPLGIEERDLTEIRGADELYEAEGIIRESEEHASALFGTGKTQYAAEGSSQVIKAMLYLCMQRALLREKTAEGNIAGEQTPVVLAARNAHKALMHTAALLDFDIRWIYPEQTVSSICACHPTPKGCREALEKMYREGILPFALYITSPDYLGEIADIRGIAEELQAFHREKGLPAHTIPLIVDNAHGAYLHFLKNPQHPMDLGAFMCSDSAHKTLPVLTGGAYLHLSEAAAAELSDEVGDALSVFGSSSPSYLILQSLDLANAYLDGAFREELNTAAERLSALKKRLSALEIPFYPSEPLKLTLDARAMGMSGYRLGDYLRSFRIEPEFTDVCYVVLMFTPFNRAEDWERVEEALTAWKKEKTEHLQHTEAIPMVQTLKPLTQKLRIREAMLSPHEKIPVSACAGRILGQPSVSCPPAVPIAVSGEVLTEERIPVFEAYGIREISVVKKGRIG